MFTAHDGSGWRLAGCLYALVAELNVWDPGWTCLGTVGDQTHADQAAYSDHNPVVRDPHTGVGIVRAIDIVCTTPAKQQWLFAHFNQMYGAGDPRLAQYGYAHLDGVITDWDRPGFTHVDPGDDGHIHLSVTQASYPSQPGGYVAAVDSQAPWGIATPIDKRPAPTLTRPTPEAAPEDDMALTLFSTIDSPTDTSPRHWARGTKGDEEVTDSTLWMSLQAVQAASRPGAPPCLVGFWQTVRKNGILNRIGA